jgi:hypothetical protein
MPTLLADAAANLDAWTMTPIAQMPTMQLAYARYLGATPVLQLHDKESLGCITTPWAPNVFRGSGSETRVTMTLNVPEATREAFELIEEHVRELLRPAYPKIDALWHSATKPGERYRSTLRAKINIAGDKMVRYVDVDGNPVDPPTNWVGLSVLPLIAVRGAYVQKTGAGLMVDVLAVMVGSVQERRDEELTFI